MADISVTAASVDPGAGATVTRYTAGATITAGQTVYSDSTDSNKVKAADADGSATAECVGIAVNGGANNQPIHVLSAGNLNPGGTVVVGEIYAVSTTAGGIAPEADLGTGDFPTLLGIGTTTSNINVQLHVGGIAKA